MAKRNGVKVAELRKGRRYLVYRGGQFGVALEAKYYGLIDGRAPGVGNPFDGTGHIFLFVGNEDSGYVLRDRDIPRRVVPYTREADAENSLRAQRYLDRMGVK